MREETSAYWDEIADGGDALPAGWRRHARHEHLRLIADWARPAGLWLKTDLFEERSPARALLPSLDTASWIGVDLSTGVAAQARARIRCRAVVADVRSLPFASSTFDGVLSTSTLDHFTDTDSIDRSLRELHRVLHAGGRLVLTLDNPRNPLIRLRNAMPADWARRTGLAPFAVGRTYDAENGRRALEAAGFVVDSTTHLLHAPHVVGTRPARFGWYERSVLPRTEAVGRTRLAPFTGHYVAFSARAT